MMTNELNDEKKLEYSAEVKTIQDQLAKPFPDKGIVSKAWGALKFVGTIGSVGDVWGKGENGTGTSIRQFSNPNVNFNYQQNCNIQIKHQ
jgi:hypothetical protein